MEALYEHFLDPRDPAFKDPRRVDGGVHAWTRVDAKYKTAEELYAELLDAEPYADAERREQLRLDASKNERHNVAFFDVTFSVQKSITVLHAAFEAPGGEGPPGRRLRGGRGVGGAQAGGRGRDLGRQQRRAGLPRRARRLLPGRASRRRRPAGSSTRTSWTVASFFQHTSRGRTIRSCTSTTRSSTGCWARTASGARWTARVAVQCTARRPGRSRSGPRSSTLARSLARAGGDAPGRQGPRDPRHRAGGQRAVLQPRRRTISPEDRRVRARAFEQRYGREPNALELRPAAPARPRCDHPARASPTTGRPWSSAWTGGSAQLQRRTDPSAWTRSPPTCSPSPNKEPRGADVRPGRGDRDRARRRAGEEGRRGPRPTSPRAINDALPDYLGGLDGAEVARADRRPHRRRRSHQHAVAADPGRPGRAIAARRAAPGRRPLRPTSAPGERLYATEAARAHRARAARGRGRAHRRARSRPSCAAAFLDELRESGIELGVDQAAAVRGVLDLRRQRGVAGRAGRHRQVASSSARSPTPGKTPPSGAASSAACVGLGHVADRHQGPARRRR